MAQRTTESIDKTIRWATLFLARLKTFQPKDEIAARWREEMIRSTRHTLHDAIKKRGYWG